uniref:Uncharacterized protein n=1 Tax=Kalanchoe fedtschenkoi TaxID=63787 RepID=A0A7N0VLP1_KALFE
MKETQPALLINNPSIFSSSTTPLLSDVTSNTSSSNSDSDESPHRYSFIENDGCMTSSQPISSKHQAYKLLTVLTGHVGSVSSLALCGEFILSASQGKDIIVWQQPDLRLFTKFGQGQGSVKALVAVGSKVFTAHQDSRIRVWKVTRSCENAFRLVDTLPTKKDYLGKFMIQSNYVQIRRHHRHLWIEHADSISCLAVQNGLVYSGSWDRTIKVWRVSDLKCLESVKAHDDAINGLITGKDGTVYSASADGKIKAWVRDRTSNKHVLKGVLEGHRYASMNSAIVSGDGRTVYGGSSDGYVMGWEKDVEKDTWSLIFEVKAHQMAVLCMCLMGEFVCSGSADKSIALWKRGGGRLHKVGIINGHDGPVKCLQAAPNGVGEGFLLYSGSLDRSLRVWWVSKSWMNDQDLHRN